MTSLSDEELERYARQVVLRDFGSSGQRAMKQASVAVIGAGGIGCAVIPALAGAGIGRLTIIDDDVVSISNLHRQPLFGEAEVGEFKAPLAAAAVNRLNRFVEVKPVQARIGPENAAELLSDHDYVVDGSDNFATRLAVSDRCVALGIPLVSAAALMFQGQVGLFHAQPCYRCWVGDAFDTEDCDGCAELGVLGAMTGTVGNFASLLLIRSIAGVEPDLSGAIHLFDGSIMRWREIKVPADPDCRACG